ncbi:MAG: Gfo/Idh/MocA family oxidoreductase [Clostridia bacterium]|nr:Gfo/Idh/MocA family oxidoreductase [Clostridia bacterium]
MLKIGFIGFGSRSASVWSSIASFGQCEVKAIADPRWEEIKKARGEEFPNCAWYADAEEMLRCETLDGIVLGTRCDLHTKYALLVARYGLPLFLEKPVSITEEELTALETIQPLMNEKTVVSFPLRLAKLVDVVKDYIDRGVIGEVAQVQAYNNVNYARGYYHKWYRDESITGGLFLQKSTHDLDYINYVLGRSGPKTICAMESKMVFKVHLRCVPRRTRCIQQRPRHPGWLLAGLSFGSDAARQPGVHDCPCQGSESGMLHHHQVPQLGGKLSGDRVQSRRSAHHF